MWLEFTWSEFRNILVYCLMSNGHTNFPKVWEPPQNCRYQQHDVKQVLLLIVNKYATVQNVQHFIVQLSTQR